MDVTWASEWVDLYRDAWLRKDPDVVGELFTQDAIYRSSPLGAPFVGREAIREYWRSTTAPQEDLELRFGQPLVHGNRVAVEWWAVMRDEGGDVTIPGCLLLRFASGGRCQELREYWHRDPGHADPPDGWGR